MPFGCLCLAFERPELTPDFTQEVLDSQQVGFGGVEPTLRLLFALAELEDARCLFDNGPTVFGTGIEHGIDLALADDDVLLTADAGITEELLDVKQATTDAVDHVLRLTGTEQDSRDGDLAEFQAECPVSVVDRDADLGSTERRPLGRTGEDDVVHLLRTHRLRRLRAEHPGNGIDHVRLTGSVRTDYDGHAGFQHHRRVVGERLETLEGEILQVHSGHEATCSVRHSPNKTTWCQAPSRRAGAPHLRRTTWCLAPSRLLRHSVTASQRWQTGQ